MKKDWNHDYIQNGIKAQRLYPNEALLQFLGREGLICAEKKGGGIKILEVGSGSGSNLWMVAKEGMDAYGVDISEKSIEIAHRHLTDKWGVHAALRKGTFDALPFQDNEFDYVIDIMSMQHIDLKTSHKALSEVRRVLKKNGKFFSYRLSDHSVMYRNGLSDERNIDAATLDDISNDDFPLNHNGTMTFWSPCLARSMYEQAGLKISNIERHTRTYQNGLYQIEYLSIVAQKQDDT